MLEGEDIRGEPLLKHVMSRGRRLTPREPLAHIRETCSQELRSLPPDVRRLSEGRASGTHLGGAAQGCPNQEPPTLLSAQALGCDRIVERKLLPARAFVFRNALLLRQTIVLPSCALCALFFRGAQRLHGLGPITTRHVGL